MKRNNSLNKKILSLLIIIFSLSIFDVQIFYAKQKKIKIKVWTMNRADAEFMNSEIAKYNEKNKSNIEIVYQIFADNYLQTVDLAFTAEEGPDILSNGVGVYEKLMPDGNLMPYDKFMDQAFKKRFNDNFFIEGINMKDGKIYAIPTNGTSPRLIYNKSIFKKVGIKEPPKTLEEFVADAKLITEKLKRKGIYGFAQNFKNPFQALMRSVDHILMRSGGVCKGYDFKTGKFDFNGYKPILNAYKEIVSSGAIFLGSETLDIDPLRTQFAQGKIGMYISWSHSEPGVYTKQFPTKEDWGMTSIPTIDGTIKGSNNPVLTGGFFINSKTKHPREVWKVIEFLYSDDLQIKYHEAGLGISIIPKVMEKAKDPEVIKKWPAMRLNKNDKIWPVIPQNITIEGNDMYSTMVDIIYGITDLDKGIEGLNNRYNRALDKAVKYGKATRYIYPNFDPANPAKSIKK